MFKNTFLSQILGSFWLSVFRKAISFLHKLRTPVVNTIHKNDTLINSLNFPPHSSPSYDSS